MRLLAATVSFRRGDGDAELHVLNPASGEEHQFARSVEEFSDDYLLLLVLDALDPSVLTR